MKRFMIYSLLCLLLVMNVGCQKKSYLEEHANETIIEDVENHDEQIMQDLKDEIHPYDRDTTKGRVVTITLDEMEKKLEHQETFAISFVTSFCSVCQSFDEVLKEYLPDHHVILYQVILDDEEASADENAARVQTYFQEFHTTPGIFYVANGRKVSYYDTDLYGVDEELFDIWVQQNQIDKKK